MMLLFQKAGLKPTLEMVEMFSYHLPKATLTKLIVSSTAGKKDVAMWLLIPQASIYCCLISENKKLVDFEPLLTCSVGLESYFQALFIRTTV